MSNIKRYSDSLVSMLICMFFFAFLIISGTLKSGYHFTDDHDILRIAGELKTQSIMSVSKNSIVMDLAIRYRPFYWVHRVYESYFLGSNISKWSIYHALLACFTFVLFYLGMRKLKFSIFESLLFIVIAFIGSQTAVWWKLGPNETIGLPFLAISFFIATSKINIHIKNIIFAISLILASLCKESFTIIIPAFIFFKIIYDINDNETTIKQAIYRNSILVIPFIIMFINLYIIFFIVGVNKIGYADIDSNLINMVKGMISILKRALLIYIAFGFALFAIIYYTFKDEKLFVAFIKKLLPALIFCLLILLPNMYLHAKCGMSERYLLPTTIGIAFFLTYIMKEIRNIFAWLHKLLLFISLLLCFILLEKGFKDASDFAEEGRKTNGFLSAIQSNYKPNQNVLLVATGGEWCGSIKTYLLYKFGIKIYGYRIDPSNILENKSMQNIQDQYWEGWFNTQEYADLNKQPEMIVFFEKDISSAFFKQTGINISDYKSVLNDDKYIIYSLSIK